jgi:hypothetical protein
VHLNEQERALLDQACAGVPPPAVTPAAGTDSDYRDYVSNLLLTVLDLQFHNKIVGRGLHALLFLVSPLGSPAGGARPFRNARGTIAQGRPDHR